MQKQHAAALAVALMLTGCDIGPEDSEIASSQSAIISPASVQLLVYVTSTGAYVGPKTTQWPGTNMTLLAIANQVPSYNEFVTIRSPTGALLARCSFSQLCSTYASAAPPSPHVRFYEGGFYQARIENIQGTVFASANASIVWTNYDFPFTASASTLTAAIGAPVTITASLPLGPSTTYSYYIRDLTTNEVKSCQAGTACQKEFTANSNTTHTFEVSLGTSLNPFITYASFRDRYITWSNAGYRIELTSGPPGSGYVHIHTNKDPSSNPNYYIQLVDPYSGQRFFSAKSGTDHDFPVWLCGNNGIWTLVGVVGELGTTWPPPGTQATSNTIECGGS